MKKEIYIVRHGETDYNRNGIVQGSGVDSSLNQTGRAQAAALFAHYGHLAFEVVLTSSLQRTHQTVQPFLEQGLTWEQHAELNELNWGEHEGKTSTPQMIAEYQRVRDSWSAGDYAACVAGGESAEALGRRLTRFVDQLLQRPERTVLICSHGRAMCGLVATMKGEALHCMNNYRHANTGLWLAHQREDAFHFVLENDQRHLSLIPQF